MDILFNYLAVAFRSIRKRKLQSSICVLGLAVASACFVLITLWGRGELRYDHFHEKAGRILRLTTTIKDANGTLEMAMTAPPLAEALRRLPETESTVRLMGPGKNVVMRYGEKIFNEGSWYFADSTFFLMFTFPLVDGDPSKVLRAPYSLVLSETVARKYFGTAGAVGKTLSVEWYDQRHDYQVTGVMRDAPQESHFHPGIIASFGSVPPTELAGGWGGVSVYTYALLRDNSSAAAFARKLPGLILENMGPALAPYWELAVQPLERIHLHSHLLLEMEQNGELAGVLTLLAAGILVLLIAVMNFISLSTASFADRTREIAVRKVLGASRKNLVLQFMTENSLIVVAAMIAGFSLSELALPGFEQLMGRPVQTDAGGLVLIFGLSLAMASLGVFYPGLLLSALTPVSALSRRSLLLPGRTLFQKVLVVAQFAAATGLIAGAIAINRQFHYVLDRDLGIRIDQTLFIPLRHPELRARYDILRNEFLRCESVRAVTASSSNPSNMNIITSLYSQGQSILGIRSLAVDYDFIRAMGVHLLSGRDFSRAVPTDSTGAIIVNEAAARKLLTLGLLDKPLELAGVPGQRKSNMVIGVIRDFHYRPLYYAIEPMVLYLGPAEFRFMEVRIAPGTTSRSITELKRTWERIVPDYPFDFTFLDESLARVYTADQRMRAVFDLFSLLAVLIGSLGLLAIASHAAEKRAKEIGIRKVLGSSVAGIVLLLSRELLLMVASAGLIASGAAYFFLRSWLETFSYRIDLTPWIFVQAIALVSLTALLTVGVRAARAAMANPVDSLRYE